jgi:1-acyl-sn-glycerol-3-phosphate acyltransferase
MERLVSVVAPLARVTQPRVWGVERLPDRGALFVGNHTIFGFMDLPFMMSELWTRAGVCVRGLGDHAHYAIPVWRDLLERAGMVRGTRDNVRALMREGEHVLVFPGGAGEVFKKRGQKYKLIWKERLGFARMAIEFGYPIVPFAAVGADDMFDVVADSDTPVVGQVSNLMKRLVGVQLPPIVAGVGPTLLPRPERLYFHFGEPIETDCFSSRHEDDDAARAVRDEVRRAVEDGIEALLAERDSDPQRSLAARLSEPPLPELAVSDPGAYFVSRAFDAWNTTGTEGAAAWMSRWVELTDPPDWPDRATWRGRDAVVARLDEVTADLGASWAELTDARSEGNEVLTSFLLRDEGGQPIDPGGFRARVGLHGDQIVRIRVFRDPAQTASTGARSSSARKAVPRS